MYLLPTQMMVSAVFEVILGEIAVAFGDILAGVGVEILLKHIMTTKLTLQTSRALT